MIYSKSTRSSYISRRAQYHPVPAGLMSFATSTFRRCSEKLSLKTIKSTKRTSSKLSKRRNWFITRERLSANECSKISLTWAWRCKVLQAGSSSSSNSSYNLRSKHAMIWACSRSASSAVCRRPRSPRKVLHQNKSSGSSRRSWEARKWVWLCRTWAYRPASQRSAKNLISKCRNSDNRSSSNTWCTRTRAKKRTLRMKMVTTSSQSMWIWIWTSICAITLMLISKEMNAHAWIRPCLLALIDANTRRKLCLSSSRVVWAAAQNWTCHL